MSHTARMLARCVVTATTEEISQSWRRLVWLDTEWRPVRNQSGALDQMQAGEAGGFFVECDAVPGRRIYMKPRRPDGGRRASREKIASDLAHDLGVPVPSVVLATRNDAGAEERSVCASLVMFPRQWSWLQIRDLLANDTGTAVDLLARPLPGAAAAGLAFDTWVEQPDHHDHPHNIIFGYDPGSPELGSYLFLDFAWACGFHRPWSGTGASECKRSPFPPLMLERLDRSELSQAIEKIENFSPDTIGEVVTRIPTTHLSDVEKATIREGLVERRGLVRAALAEYL